VVSGADCTDMSEDKRTLVRLNAIGFVYQFHHLLPEFSALDNVALPQRVAGKSEADARKRAAPSWSGWAWAGACTTSRRSSPAASSSAWRWPARSPTSPGLILADEPTGNLDPHTSEDVFGALHDLTRRRAWPP
jgi:lipoprotein-releasing system ATP-binding protein